MLRGFKAEHLVEITKRKTLLLASVNLKEKRMAMHEMRQ